VELPDRAESSSNASRNDYKLRVASPSDVNAAPLTEIVARFAAERAFRLIGDERFLSGSTRIAESR